MTYAGSSDASEGSVVSHTPYDPYLEPVRKTFARLRGSQPTIDEVRANLRTARRFHYYFDKSNPYRPIEPEITEATHQGDCKAKSLWLAWKMDDRRIRFAIGKAQPGSQILHAWLLWKDGNKWYALDPTKESDVLSLERIAGRKLLPKYSYSISSKYAHTN